MLHVFKHAVTLTRWREFLPFTIPLTVFGALFAHFQTGATLDYRLLAVIIANVFCVAYAFMINDIEDAPDDALDSARAHKNVIASGKLEPKYGYLACQITSSLALFFYLYGGLQVVIIGVFSLLLSHFYSWRPVRLKAWPITDIASHSLMLSGLLLLAGYYAYSTSPGKVWWIVAASILFSAYGQIYNQLRDFKTDKLAGLKNTAILLGKEHAKQLMYFCLVAAGFCLLVSIYKGVFPLWVILGIALSVPISRMKTSKRDMRGSEFVDVTGKMQLTGTILMNVIALLWLIQAVVSQVWL